VLRGLHLPRRVRQIIEGESLLNDATALLIYRIAAGAALGGVTLANAAPQVAAALIGSPIVGYLAGRLYMLMGRRLEDPATLAVTSFVGTFGVWIIAERLGLSAIVTVVVYAITIARRANALMSPRNRISTYSVWETAIFTLNVLAFLIMGLQARTIIDRLAPNDIGSALAFGGAVLAAVIAVRVVYLIGYVGLVRLKNRWFGVDLAPGLTPPTLRGGVLVSWSGMRGLVTLAAAFALPEGFPHRDLIVLSAFSVVLGTLVLQGLTLKPLVGLLKLPADDSVLREVSLARQRMLRAAIEALEDKSSKHAGMLRAGFTADLDVAENITAPQGATERDRLKLRAVQAQRRELVRLRQSGEIDDEAYHRLEEELDWAELEATPAGVYAPLTSTGE
jgi:monovalent cation/hydrogen antiporter